MVGGATLRANVYVPPAAFGNSFSAIVLAHGGGWWRGCRTTNAEEAAHLSGTDTLCTPQCTSYPLPYHSFVLAIDYRLSCRSDDPNLKDSPILPFCDWRYDTYDNGPDGHTVGAAIHDVESAISWAKPYLTQNYGSLWNGKLAVVGNSAGGTPAYNAAARYQTGTGGPKVDAVGAWSGSLQFDYLSDAPPDGSYPCFDGMNGPTIEIKPMNGTMCSSRTQWYLDCDQQPYPAPHCKDSTLGNDRFKFASPLNDFTFLPANFVPVFFSNGGGDGTNTGTCSHDGMQVEYLVACVSAQDFTNQGLLGWDSSMYNRCIVDTPLHAQSLIYEYRCGVNGNPDTLFVIQRMVTFFHDHGV